MSLPLTPPHAAASCAAALMVTALLLVAAPTEAVAAVQCHTACLPGMGCGGPAAGECHAAVLTASPTAMAWALPPPAAAAGGGNGNLTDAHASFSNATFALAANLTGNAAPIVGVAVDARAGLWRGHAASSSNRGADSSDAVLTMTAYALGSDCRVWAANVSTSPSHVVQRATVVVDIAAAAPARRGGVCSSMSADAVASTGALVVTMGDGSVVRVRVAAAVSSGEAAGAAAAVAQAVPVSTLLPASSGATCAAAHPDGGMLYYGTALDSGGSVVGVEVGPSAWHVASDAMPPDAAFTISGLGSAVASLTVDAARGRVVWTTAGGAVGSASAANGGDAVTELVNEGSLVADVGGVSVVVRSAGGAGDGVLAEGDVAGVYVVDAAVRVPLSAPADAVVFKTVLAELSAGTQTGGGGDVSDWAPADTVQANDEMGGWGNGISQVDDVDGDGVSDMLIGIVYDDSASSTRAGSILVVRLRADGTVKAQPHGVTKVTQGTGVVGDAVTALQLTTWTYFGSSVVGLEDWDGDGVPEAAVGARGTDSNKGAVWVLHLTSSGEAREAVKIDDAAMSGSLLDSYDYFGHGLSALPDIDGDNRQELVVGAYGDSDGGSGRGAVYIVFLQPSNASYRAHTKISGTSGAGLTLINPSNSQWFGYSCAVLGDVTADGGMEVVVGAITDDDGSGSNAGAVYMLSLSPVPTSGATSVVATSKLSAEHGGLAEAGFVPAQGDQWGAGASTLPDLDGDGHRELIVGTRADYATVLFLGHTTESTSDGGILVRAAVVLSADASSPLPSAAKARIAADSDWGAGVASLGYLAADGSVALAVAAPRPYDTAGGDASGGAVFIITLEPPPLESFVAPRLVRVSVVASARDASSVAVAAASSAAGDTLTVVSPALPAGTGIGVSAVSRACYAGCAGGCMATDGDATASGAAPPLSCHIAGGCATASGHGVTSDGSGACCPRDSSDASRPLYFRWLNASLSESDGVSLGGNAWECGVCDETCGSCDSPGDDACLTCASQLTRAVDDSDASDGHGYCVANREPASGGSTVVVVDIVVSAASIDACAAPLMRALLVAAFESAYCAAGMPCSVVSIECSSSSEQGTGLNADAPAAGFTAQFSIEFDDDTDVAAATDALNDGDAIAAFEQLLQSSFDNPDIGVAISAVAVQGQEDAGRVGATPTGWEEGEIAGVVIGGIAFVLCCAVLCTKGREPVIRAKDDLVDKANGCLVAGRDFFGGHARRFREWRGRRRAEHPVPRRAPRAAAVQQERGLHHVRVPFDNVVGATADVEEKLHADIRAGDERHKKRDEERAQRQEELRERDRRAAEAKTEARARAAERKRAVDGLRARLSPEVRDEVHTFEWEEVTAAMGDQYPHHPVAEGMASRVYVGELSDETATAVIVKVSNIGVADLAAAGLTEEQLRDIFVREIEVSARFRHKHVVPQLGFAVSPDGKGLALVSERMMEGDLCHYMAEHGGEMAALQRVRVLLGIAKGVAYMHMGGDRRDGRAASAAGGVVPVAHRDLSSKNVGLSRSLPKSDHSDADDDALVPRLLDLGTSLSLAARGAHTMHQTQSGGVISSPGYAAPELSTTRTWGLGTDVYCFGVITLELLTGKPPVDAGGLELRGVYLEDERPVSEKVDDRVEWPLDTAQRLHGLAKECLKTDPAKRPTARDVVAHLNVLFDDITSDAGGVREVPSESERRIRLDAIKRYVDLDVVAGAGGGGGASGPGGEMKAVPLRECAVCDDDVLPATGATCIAGAHFACGSCLDHHVAQLLRDVGRFAAEGGAIRCVGAGCGHTFDLGSLRPVLAAETFDKLSDKWRELLEAADRMREDAQDELRRERELRVAHERATKAMAAAIAKAAESRGEAKEDIEAVPDAFVADARKQVEDVFTLKCGRCGAGYYDFDGCAAINHCGAAGCTAAFCAYCGEDCGRDAHDHVIRAHADLKPLGEGLPLFIRGGTDADRMRNLVRVMKPMRVARLVELFRGWTLAQQVAVAEHVRGFLADEDRGSVEVDEVLDAVLG